MRHRRVPVTCHLEQAIRERSDVVGGKHEVRFALSQILRTPALITDDARQPARHRFVDHQSPRFAVIARQYQTIRRYVGARDFGLVEEAGKGGSGKFC